MKAKAAGLLTGLFVFGMVAVAQASLTTVGTATYGGNDYNLIYEDDSINGGLVWLDYTPSVAYWWIQKDWAEGVGGSLTVNLDPGYTSEIDWSTGWRLPLTPVSEPSGFGFTGSEMGHLYYVSLGNSADQVNDPGLGLVNTGDFDNLHPTHYWSYEYSWNPPAYADFFRFDNGVQGHYFKDLWWSALAVHPGTVSAVPLPSSIWLLLAGLGILRNRKRRHSAM